MEQIPFSQKLPKTSVYARLYFIFSFIHFAIFFFILFLYKNTHYKHEFHTVVLLIWLPIYGFTSIILNFLMRKTLKQINLDNDRIIGEGELNCGSCINTVAVLLILTTFTMVLPYSDRYFAIKNKNTCHRNLNDLSIALLQYQNSNNGRLPIADKWNDSIAKYVKDPKEFQCPLAEGRCSYAFNSELDHIRVKSIKDTDSTVLLFDAQPGWNKSGGVEMAQYRHEDEFMWLAIDGSVSHISKNILQKIKWSP